MKLNKKQFNKWIEALDSGEYKQARGYLQGRYGFCCLGVACKILIPDDKIAKDEHGRIDGALPDNQPHSPKWLDDINDKFLDKTGEYSLSDLNDDENFTFTEVATMLELVFVHKALK